MVVLTVDDIKRNSRIEEDAEDALIAGLGEVAEAAVSTAIRQPWGLVAAEYGEIPAPLRHACLMLADHYYNNRGATAAGGNGMLPLGVECLIKPYIKLRN